MIKNKFILAEMVTSPATPAASRSSPVPCAGRLISTSGSLEEISCHSCHTGHDSCDSFGEMFLRVFFQEPVRRKGRDLHDNSLRVQDLRVSG